MVRTETENYFKNKIQLIDAGISVGLEMTGRLAAMDLRRIRLGERNGLETKAREGTEAT